ncbi:MAG: D-alanyl-D-alanine carboxypeptidase [Bacteriovorax sp.]|jgi:D-alanyl-D-alanine carboxypeptidase/D-alanyl-D-alanine-endopeptidase (penicillin-binding protein 4)|nr:D-alanyl-D-alanine carboxypeptidase [Bacteriovorax sp.]
MKKTNNILLSSLLLFSFSVTASEKTDKIWKQEIKKQALDLSNQSYCYTNEEGKVEGDNVDMRVRLASVSKLLTSLWAVEKLGVDYTYDLKLFIKGNHLHIQGSYDPFLGNEKMFYLISQLNELGYERFDSITFDKNLKIFPDAQLGVSEYPVLNLAWNAKYVTSYFNTETWSKYRKSEYREVANLAREGRFLRDINFSVGEVKSVEANPYLNDPTAKVLTLSSPPLYRYLKELNVKSNNYAAETIFRHLGGVSKFEQFLKDRFKLTSDQIYFYSGSGLPDVIDGKRKDNYGTCSIVLNLISQLKASVEKQNKEIEDVVAVPGNDKGTFKHRIFSEDYRNSFVAKTGTLYHTSALAGAMNTRNGFSYFGIFNQSEDISGSKGVQNSMVRAIMTDMGGPMAFNYEVSVFHTYAPETLKDFDYSDDFSTIEGGLF